MKREKIAILGGGPSALTAAYHLSSTPSLRERYEITVYQMGWRLGGKGASGRGAHGRIEEHGLHILFGFYQNFFQMMRGCYEELDRPSGVPLATWREAFHPESFGVVEDWFHGQWYPWSLQFPRNHAVPGSGEVLNSAGTYLSTFLQGLIELLFGERALEWTEELRFPLRDWLEGKDENPSAGEPDAVVRLGLTLLRWGLEVARDTFPLLERDRLLLKAMKQLRGLLWSVLGRLARVSMPMQRTWLGLDFAAAVVTGLIVDGVLLPGGYDKIDGEDFRQWLARHGAHPQTLDTPYVRSVYDAAFSYADGLYNRQEIAAGSALRTLVRMALSYKGAFYYKMQAGMGDTVFAPLYQVLKKRGVRFRFFHKVQALRLSEDKRSIAQVDIQRQVDLKSGNPQSYEPLFDVKGLPCWPSEPLWEQLRDTDKLQHLDLESYYSGYSGVEQLHLKAGRDYDQVLLGTPIACIPFLCQELLDDNVRWRRMVEKVKAVQTASFQIWLKKDLRQLGWRMPSPLLSVYAEPLNTWCDMSQVLVREDWPTGLAPRNVSYFTGAQPGPDRCPPPTEQDFPKRMNEDAKRLALTYLEQNLGALLPGAVNPEAPLDLDWKLLVDEQGREGRERFDAQYWRSNCEPQERCTVALPGTNQYRLEAGDTGYRNLFITGDWIDNGFYVACMEGAIMGGLYAARAISGLDFPIIGERLDRQ